MTEVSPKKIMRSEAMTAAGSSKIAPPAPVPRRHWALHWLAWLAAALSLVVLSIWKWAPPHASGMNVLRGTDLALAVFFAVEFFTRTGWRRSRMAYLRWRWFDFIALLPVTAFGAAAVAPVVWVVLVCRVIRLVDRTLGDGFVQRNTLVLLGAAEEEISDRVLEKMLGRWERELDHANFGTSIAQALTRNKTAVLQRVYAQQLQDGTFAKIAHFTGLQGMLEKEEERLFSAVIEMVGSHEVDEAIRDVIASSLRRTREELGASDWRRRLGTEKPVHGEASPPARLSPAPGVGRVHAKKGHQA